MSQSYAYYASQFALLIDKLSRLSSFSSSYQTITHGTHLAVAWTCFTCRVLEPMFFVLIVILTWLIMMTYICYLFCVCQYPLQVQCASSTYFQNLNTQRGTHPVWCYMIYLLVMLFDPSSLVKHNDRIY